MNDPVVLYHAPCLDGWCSSFVAKQALGYQAECIPVSYGTGISDYILARCKDNDLYILDFCYPPEVLNKLAGLVNKMVVIDHHITAKPILDQFIKQHKDPRFEVTFDLERSGAGLTWDYFHDTQRPWLVNYIEDHDLWKKKLPDTDCIHAYLQSLDYDHDQWQFVSDHVTIKEAASLGRTVLDFAKKHIKETKKFAKLCKFDEYIVPVVNTTPTCVSDIVGQLAEGFPFAVGWYQNADGKFVYSFRSKGGFDVAKFAAKYGGGGHAAASGAILSKPTHFRTKYQWLDPSVPWFILITLGWLIAFVIAKQL